MVLLPDLSTFYYSTLISRIRNTFTIESETTDARKTILKINGEEIYLSAVSLPVPSDDINEIARGTYNWPSAREDLKDHAAHITLILTENGTQDVVKRFKLLTRLTGMLLNVANGLAFYSAEQSLLISKDTYLKEAERMSDAHLPLNLWIYFGIKEINGKANAYTRGLKAFGKSELEVIDSDRHWSDVRKMLFRVCHYLLTNDANFKAGQTFNYTDGQKIEITYSDFVFVYGNCLKLVY